MKYNVKELETFQKIGIACLLFVISGIIGWIVEFIFYYFNGGMKEFYWQGGNFLPWMNIYAIGAFLMFGITYKYRSNPLTVFVLSIVSATILEFTAGYILDKFCDLRFWDYNVEILNFGNINGYICLRSVLGFGIAGLFLMYILIPSLIKLSETIPKKVFLTISISLCSIFLIDELYNLFFARLLNLPTAMEVYENLGMKYVPFNE